MLSGNVTENDITSNSTNSNHTNSTIDLNQTIPASNSTTDSN